MPESVIKKASSVYTIPNPDLVVVEDDKPNWNLPENRRRAFHNFEKIMRYSIGIRAPRVLPLTRRIDRRIGDMPEVRRLTGTTFFSAMVVLRGTDLLFETYASDFAPEQCHSMQSITKCVMNLILGKLVEDGLIDLTRKVKDYIPEIGSGYAEATIQQVLDMNVINNFDENYDASYRLDPHDGAPVGYNREEIALGWRLPPEGEQEFGSREFAASLVSNNVNNPTEYTEYRSPNTDILGWIAEKAAGRKPIELLTEVIEAAGIEGTYHIGLDADGIPQFAGGGCMTARDMARYGLLFARSGLGVNGVSVGSASFIQETRNGRGTKGGQHRYYRYSNSTFTNGRWLGHGGYGGQFMLADPDTGTAISFFSVLEDQHAFTDDYLPEVTRCFEEIIDLYIES
tara:strand:- start:516 stop:1712 length:1197 start_codon:yes stop_codon:yes gene_type:complete